MTTNRILAVAVAVVGMLVAPRAASARSDMPSLEDVLVRAAEALDKQRTPIATPVLILGGGYGTDGFSKSVAAGYAWGSHAHGGILPGGEVRRVLFGARFEGASSPQTSLSLTYGWYTNGLGSIGLDVGVEANIRGSTGVGPTGRLMIGGHGIGVRFGGSLIAGAESHGVATIELVIDVMDLSGMI